MTECESYKAGGFLCVSNCQKKNPMKRPKPVMNWSLIISIVCGGKNQFLPGTTKDYQAAKAWFRVACSSVP